MEHGFLPLQHQFLAYAGKNPSREPMVFFVHGNSASHRLWLKQLASPDLADYSLVAFDLPAHGDSSPSPEPEADYSLPVLGRQLADAVTQMAGNRPYVLVGSSFGTNCVAEMIACGLRPQGLVLAGSSVFGEGLALTDFVNPALDMSILFTDDGDGDLLFDFVSKSCFPSDKEDIRNLIDDYYRVAAPFRSTVIASVMAGRFSDQISNIKKLNKPVLLVFGEKDNMVDVHYLDKSNLPLWRDQPFILPGAGHLANLDQPEAFNKLLCEFLNECLPPAK